MAVRPPSLTKLERSLKIVGLGDSTTAGTPGFLSPIEAPPNGRGDVESQYAYWMMKARPLWLVLNRGVGGERSDEILRRFNRDVLREKPEYTIILAGVNDIYQGVAITRIEENLRRMYRLSFQVGIVPVVATVLPYDTAGEYERKSIREINSWIKTESQNLLVPFCDTNAATADKGDPDMLSGSPDGVHPGVQGYHAMADGLVEAITSHLERASVPS